MISILTAQEAANFVRTEPTDVILLQLIPLVDQYLLNATGHDWAADFPPHPTAQSAAGILLMYWYDRLDNIGQAPESLTAMLLQLEAEALKYRKICFYGNNGMGAVSLPGARIGDEVITLTGVYGVSGDQKSKFESVIDTQNQIQQTDAGDHSAHQYVAVLKNPAEDVNA